MATSSILSNADIASLQLYAGIHRKAHRRYHRLLSRRFPFAVFYTVAGRVVSIHAVLDLPAQPLVDSAATCQPLTCVGVAACCLWLALLSADRLARCGTPAFFIWEPRNSGTEFCVIRAIRGPALRAPGSRLPAPGSAPPAPAASRCSSVTSPHYRFRSDSEKLHHTSRFGLSFFCDDHIARMRSRFQRDWTFMSSINRRA